jgi:hypothetical protein
MLHEGIISTLQNYFLTMKAVENDDEFEWWGKFAHVGPRIDDDKYQCQVPEWEPEKVWLSLLCSVHRPSSWSRFGPSDTA